ncbi:biotin synthase BioB [Fibrobacterota bacterium]
MEKKVLDGAEISPAEALDLMKAEGPDLMSLFASAGRIREKFCGRRVHLCGIVNAKSGVCPEDCAFCSQSIHHNTDVPEYRLMDSGTILEASRKAVKDGAGAFGIVTAWRGIRKGGDLDNICEALRNISDEGRVEPHVSLGIIEDPEVARMLADAGALEYNINLETARSFFPSICMTHSHADRVSTVRYVKAAGMRVCCGGILGLGESPEQRVELAMELRELKVDTVPLNFYHHQEGNRVELAKVKKMQPLEALKIAAVFRHILPSAVLKIAGGRETTLGEFQCMMFLAGLNSTMVGNYLTTAGRDAMMDVALVEQSGLRIGAAD